LVKPASLIKKEKKGWGKGDLEDEFIFFKETEDDGRVSSRPPPSKKNKNMIYRIWSSGL
jgi:hypothetical protein